MGHKIWSPLAVMTVFSAINARADVGPRIKIIVPDGGTAQARPDQEFASTIELHAGDAGTLSELELFGTGWRVHSLQPDAPVDLVAGEIITVSFRAVPAEGFGPLRFRAKFNGFPVSKRLDLSPELRARPRLDHNLVGLARDGRVLPNLEIQTDSIDRNTAGGSVSIRFRGRIVYQRMDLPPDQPVGADNIYFEIKDDDSPASDETIYSGVTDVLGNFDVTVDWDDCDVLGCDDPDIYLRYETDNGEVKVMDADDDVYAWSTEDTNTIEDFTGSEVDFGTVMSADASKHPAIHIQNSIVRAHRFILSRDGTNVESVGVIWPEAEGGSGAYYKPDDEQIHISATRQWAEDTHTHEYGHHFLENYSVNPTPDYANGICDTDRPGHCMWCDETDHDAWNEGWPNWLADIVTRSYPGDYSGYTPISTRSQENIQTTCGCCITGYPCCAQDTAANDPWKTEGYAGALLRDMDDPDVDDHDGSLTPFNCNATSAPQDCDMDSINLGTDEIFNIVKTVKPSTIRQFIDAYWAAYPQYHQDGLGTIRNVAEQFSASLTLSPPVVMSHSSFECATFLEGSPLTLNVQGDGSMLRYQWRRDGTDLANSANVSGAWCPTLNINAVAATDGGTYDARVGTCNGTLFTISPPVRVTVYPARGAGTNSGSWGRNDQGQLGRGVNDPYNYYGKFPAPMVALSDAVSISPGPGSWHKLALKSDGTVWAWGANLYYGQLGADSNVVRWAETPFQVPGLHDIIEVGAGPDYSLALTAGGKVLVWGIYSMRGSTTYPAPPGHIASEVEGLECVIAIAAGGEHAAVVKSDGTVWAWGYNTEGQLGQGTTYFFQNIPIQVPGITNAVAVAAGESHTLVLLADGTVRAFGRNSEGQLGDGTFTRRASPVMVPNLTGVKAVRAGLWHSFAILQDQTTRGWGKNTGTLGTGNWDIATTPVQPLDVGTVLDVEAGYYHTLFLRTDHTVWATGWNVSGELGPRPNPDPNVPLPIAGINNAKVIGAGSGTSFALVSGVGPYVIQQPVNVVALVGQPVSFSILAFGTQDLTYHWRNSTGFLSDGNGISGANSPSLAIESATVAMAGSYTVLVENGFGAAVSLPGTLTLNCPNGDADCDGLIDAADAATLAECLNGPGRPRPAACDAAAFGNFDANNDNDVDLRDAAVLQRCFAGEDFINPACGQ